MSFLFERNFDDEAEASSLPINPQGPALSAAEAARLRADAFEEGQKAGFAAGEAAGRAQALGEFAATTEARVAELLATLTPQIAQMRAELAGRHLARERDLIALCHSLARQFWPELQMRFSARRLEAFCRRALHLAEGPQGLEITLHPDDLAALSAALGAQTTAEGAPLLLRADPTQRPGTARATWAQGAAEFAPEQIANALFSTLDQLERESAQPLTEAPDEPADA